MFPPRDYLSCRNPIQPLRASFLCNFLAEITEFCIMMALLGFDAVESIFESVKPSVKALFNCLKLAIEFLELGSGLVLGLINLSDSAVL